jgi:tRNA(fMet)-specific endonuclease VapC
MLDTNACIGVINGNPPTLRNRLLLEDPTSVAISQIVRYELEFGICKSAQPDKNRANLLHFLKYVLALDWGEEPATEAALIRCELARKGQPIGHYDTLIAAHARSLDAILITHNTREFEKVDALHVEDWELS